MSEIKLREPMAPIEQWLAEPYFVGSVATSLRPYWRQKIIEYFHGDKREFLFTGSQRIGKSFCACVILMRYIYEIYHVVDFPVQFGLDATTLPKIIFFSFSKAKADSTGIDRLIRLIDKAPWFSDGGRKRRPVQSFVEFPWVQVLSGVNESHATGEDLLGAILDEANVRHTAKDNQVANAQKLFTEIVARSYTTFSWEGKWNGFSGLLSTTGSQSSFIDNELQRGLTTGEKFIVQGAIYDFAPEKFAKEHFDVFIGNGDIRPFVTDIADEVVKNEIMQSTGLLLDQFLAENSNLIIHPPVDLKRFFVDDIDYALPNLAGVSQASTMLFFKKKKDIDALFDNNLPRPITQVMPNIGIYDDFDVESYFDEELLLRDYHGEPVYGHNDISQSNDRTGIALVFYNEETHKIQTLWWSFLYHNRKIPDNEISQEKIVMIYKYLINVGVNFKKITCDQYASVYVLQQLKLALGKEKVDRLSVDEDATQYLSVLNLARAKRLDCYPEPLARKQLEELIYDRYLNKVDHPHNSDPVGKGLSVENIFYDGPRYGKDILDGLAGAVWNCSVNENVSYEDLLVQNKLEKKRTPVDPSDFYADLADEDDGFYSDLADEEQLTPDEEVDDFESSLLSSLY